MNEYEGDHSSSSMFRCDDEETIQQNSCEEGSSHQRQQFFETKRLKFGIDSILSSECSLSNGTNQKHAQTSQAFCPSYEDNVSDYFWQYDTRIVTPSCFYHPPMYFPLPSMPLLPTMRTHRNFFVDTNGEISTGGSTSKRKRIWSRAVFSKLQRKGLESRFKVQKYIMKPDRKQLAAALGLTDAQVKVWFQNRRMKWRNRKENVTQNESSKS